MQMWNAIEYHNFYRQDDFAGGGPGLGGGVQEDDTEGVG